MKKKPKAKRLLRCMAEVRDGQWVAMCLDFDLVAQGDTFVDVKAKLHHQIRCYYRDATVGPDKDQREYFLSRRAPLRYWAKYYGWVALSKVDGLGKRLAQKFELKHYQDCVPA